MIRNQLLIAWRHALRNKTVTAVNSAGLALAMTCSIFIVLWVLDEYRFNRFHEKLDSIHVIVSEQFFNGQYNYGDRTVYPLADVIKNYAPEIKEVVRINAWQEKASIRFGEKHFMEQISYVDPGFLQVFTFPMISGDPKTALADPSSLVITDTAAKKYFNDDSPQGKLLMVSNGFVKQEFVVAGVVKAPPSNSSIQFDILMPMKLFEKHHNWLNWGTSFIQTYVEIDPADKRRIEEKIAQVPVKHHDWEYEIFLQAFGDTYLFGEFKENRVAQGRIQYIWIFTVIGVLIILMGCVNFTNIFMASATKRVREVGLRKVMGADRVRLIQQFLTESVLTALIALILAVSITQVLLPFFNDLTGKSLIIPYDDVPFLLGAAVFASLLGVIAGIFPAVSLATYNPRKALDRQLLTSSRGRWLKRSVIIFQLFVSVALIASTLVIYKQLSFIGEKNLGMNKENVVYVPIHEKIPYQHFTAFENEIARIPGIDNYTFAGENPLTIYHYSGDLTWAGKDPLGNNNVYFTDVGYDFLETLGIELIEGRTFSREIATDTMNFMVNQEAARMIGEDALNKKLEFWGREGRLIGIFKDFNHKTLHSSIGPMMLRLIPNETMYLMVRISPANLEETVASIASVYGKFEDEYPFEYHFLDEHFRTAYQTDRVLGRFSLIFSIIAIVISCLGLYGLIALTVEQKTKEIGIRKVLGASINSLLIYLSSHYIIWVVVANLLAWPLAWYFVNDWLNNFAYQTEISVWVFILSGILVMSITLLTIAGRTFKAARRNPVDSLRYE